MKRLVLLVLALAACSAFAQPVITRGGALKKRQYQTYAPVTLYVDPTGSDSNPCTASGTAACLTIQAAVNKLPPVIRHTVIINIAAGTYAPFIVDGFDINRGASITLQGSATWTNYTPPSGNATGTISTYTASTITPMARAFITDVGQSLPAKWAPGEWDNLRGRYLVTTGGTGAGQYRVITETNVTSISLARSFSTPLPVAGTTYAIQEPSTVVSITTGASGDSAITLGRVNGQVYFNDLKVTINTGASATPTLYGVAVNNALAGTTSTLGAPTTNLRLSLQRVQVVDVGGQQTGYFINTAPSRDAVVVLTDVSLIGGNNSSGLYYLNGDYASLSGCYSRGQRDQISTFAKSVLLSSSQFDSSNITTSTVVYRINPPANVTLLQSWFVCTAGSAFAYYGGVPAMTADTPGVGISGSFSSYGCAAGMRLQGGNVYRASSYVEVQYANNYGYLPYGYVGAAGFALRAGAVVDLSALTTGNLVMANNGPDGGVDYELGPEQYSEAFLSTFPTDAGLAVSNPYGTVIRR